MILESVEKLCIHLGSKPPSERLDITEITESLQGFGLTEAETDLALQFLKRYFLELDESGSKAKLAQYARDIFQE